MSIAKIVRITPDGAAFTTANGTFYPYQVGLDDHRSGQANSKSNPPPWRVGEIVGYSVTGQTPRGVDKFKITRSPDASFGNYVPPAGPPQTEGNPDFEAAPENVHRPSPSQPKRSYAPQSAPANESRVGEPPLKINLPAGQTVGMAVKLAGDILLAENPKLYLDDGWSNRLREVAARIILVSRSLETDTPLEDVPF